MKRTIIFEKSVEGCLECPFSQVRDIKGCGNETVGYEYICQKLDKVVIESEDVGNDNNPIPGDCPFETEEETGYRPLNLKKLTNLNTRGLFGFKPFLESHKPDPVTGLTHVPGWHNCRQWMYNDLYSSQKVRCANSPKE